MTLAPAGSPLVSPYPSDNLIGNKKDLNILRAVILPQLLNLPDLSSPRAVIISKLCAFFSYIAVTISSFAMTQIVAFALSAL